MNELIIILVVIIVILIILLITKANKVSKLEHDINFLRRGINIFSIIVTKANVLNVPPKDLPDEFDED